MLGALYGFLPWQMFEARLVLEASVAALATERATDEHIADTPANPAAPAKA